jgi:hypothetical protein
MHSASNFVGSAIGDRTKKIFLRVVTFLTSPGLFIGEHQTRPAGITGQWLVPRGPETATRECCSKMKGGDEGFDHRIGHFRQGIRGFCLAQRQLGWPTPYQDRDEQGDKFAV